MSRAKTQLENSLIVKIEVVEETETMSQAIKDFVRGMGQAIDLGATAAPIRGKTRRKYQVQRVASHWERVGGYLQNACESVASGSRSE